MKMKCILFISLLGIIAVGSTWAQESPTGFRFTWESGEFSRDMSVEDNTWQLNGRTLTYKQTISGRNEGMPGLKPPFREKVALNKGQLAKLSSLLEGLVNENSISLLPKNFEGILLEYTLDFGTPPRTVTFSAPQFDIDKFAKPPSSDPAQKLFFKMDELRDYLMTLSS
jgi:hypothetical protein